MEFSCNNNISIIGVNENSLIQYLLAEGYSADPNGGVLLLPEPDKYDVAIIHTQGGVERCDFVESQF